MNVLFGKGFKVWVLYKIGSRISWGCFFVAFLCGISFAGEEESIRASALIPLREIRDLITQKKYADAIQKFPQLDAIDGLNKIEIDYIERLRSVAAMNTGDWASAIKSLQLLLSNGKLNEQERDNAVEMLTSAQMRLRDYKSVITNSDEYLAAGGKNDKVKLIRAKANYIAGAYALAAKQSHALIDAAIADGKVPEHELLKLEASCYLKLDDSVSYTALLTRIIAYYPSPSYWQDLLERIRRREDSSPNDKLEAYRIQFSVGALQNTEDYFEMATLAMRAGYPAEARTVLKQGEAEKKFSGTGESERYATALAAVENALSDDIKLLPKPGVPPAIKDSNHAVNNGFDLVLNDRMAEGINLMQHGIDLGKLRRQEEAQYHLAYAYVLSGDKNRGKVEFSKLKDAAGAIGNLARLWLIYLDTSPQNQTPVNPHA